MDNPEKILEIKDCNFAAWGDGTGLKNFSLEINEGDVFALMSDSNEDAHLLFRAIASLEKPISGSILHRGKPLDYTDHRFLLPYKRKIGYIAYDAALLSNRNLGENLLISRRYYESKKKVKLDETILPLCRRLEIDTKLSLLPSAAHKEDIRLCVIVREILKKPDILLVERPGTHLDKESRIQFSDLLHEIAESGQAMVFYSFHQELVHDISTKKIRLKKGLAEVSAYDKNVDYLDLTPGSEAARA